MEQLEMLGTSWVNDVDMGMLESIVAGGSGLLYWKIWRYPNRTLASSKSDSGMIGIGAVDRGPSLPNQARKRGRVDVYHRSMNAGRSPFS